MKHITFTLLLLLLMSTAFSASKITYPTTAKGNVADSYFGVQVQDPYRWLENDTSATTAAWV